MSRRPGIAADVSVAGCLGYDVLVIFSREIFQTRATETHGQYENYYDESASTS
jgi:hypothetical protein